MTSMEMPTCQACGSHFEVPQEDLAFYERVSPVIAGKVHSIPPPTCCPSCRRQRRLAFRNERKLYRRMCDLCRKEVVSVYEPGAPYKVYCAHCWWSDAWDPLREGRAYNASFPFFEQFDALLHDVPKLALMQMHAENADYTTYTISYRNSYMCVSGFEGENLFYTYYVSQCHDCMDCSILYRSELCYECTYGDHLYHCIHCFDCESTSESVLCQDCKSCSCCIGCVGLRGKQYHILNKQCTKEEYERQRLAFQEDFHAAYDAILPRFQELVRAYPHCAAKLVNCEGSTGHLLYNCRDARECFECTDLEDAKYCTNVLYSKDCYDCHYFPHGELMLEVVSSNRPSHQRFCIMCWESHDLLYCYECMNCRDCFGCSGLRQQQYCIVNKQYTKEEYEELVPRIIEHMQQRGEYGEFFPITLSTFAYNESIACDEYPLGREEVLRRVWKWKEESDATPEVTKIIPASQLPARISDIPDDILEWAIQCEVTRRPFRIVKPELQFYRTMHLPIPRLHPDERHRRRMVLRNPRKLWNRTCAKCQKPIATSYAPDRPEIVVCEECYLKEVY